ncbi:MAG TPA: DUF6206 family protein [Streptosporangiaceae bacterium]
MPAGVPDAQMEELELGVQRALDRGDAGDLDVLGYGEVTLVLRLACGGSSYACKRLPVFPNAARFDQYRRTLERYLARLAGAGVTVAETSLWHTALPSGGVVAYCIQAELPGSRLCSRLLGDCDDAWAGDFIKRFTDIVERTVTPDLGLDAQAANWLDIDGELVYVDVTTPLMRDAGGRELLDVPLFFTSLPWLIRAPVRMAASKSIFDKFYSARGVLVDFLGNLHKEGLGQRVPGFAAYASERLDTPIGTDEVATYYRQDARTWEVLQRLRRADRLWQRQVRRRSYPFLLPPPISR